MDTAKAHKMERWTSVLVLALTVVFLAVIWTVYYELTEGDQEQSRQWEGEQLTRTARVLAVEMTHFMGESRLALDLLAEQIRFHPDRDPLADPEFMTLTKVLIEHHQGELDLAAVARNGDIHSYGPEPKPAVSVADRTYFQVQVPYPGAGFFVDQPIQSRFTGRWTVVMSEAAPVNRGQLAVLLVGLDFQHLDQLVDRLTLEAHETVSLYRSDGTLLYRFPRLPDFPRGLKVNPTAEIMKNGMDAGLLKGPDWQAYHQVSFAPVWVVVTQQAGTISRQGELWTWVQLRWVLWLSAALVAAGGALLTLLKKLRVIHEAHERQALTDSLTGLLNRRAFLDRCAHEQLRARRQPAELGLLLMDLDHFKQVNDRYGHQTGDRVLKDFAGALGRVLRATDAIARIGGEEFAVLLTGTALTSAQETAERVRAEVALITLPGGNQTTSIGVSLWDGEETFDLWYQRTDQALYRAKSGGRNRVELALPAGKS